MKKINTLIEDMMHVLDTGEGWTPSVQDLVMETTDDILQRRMLEREEREPTLRMSNVGTPCERQLWYRLNKPEVLKKLRPETIFLFLYGDLIEAVVVGLAVASGHEVTHIQEEYNIAGIKGHMDCAIDGIPVDIKSASPFSFTKFKEGLTPETDGFGYLRQLKNYSYGFGADQCAFLAVNKVNGSMCLDVHSVNGDDVVSFIEHRKDVITCDTPPDRGFSPVPDGKSGNMKLPFNCSYCDGVDECWPNKRTFFYSDGPRYLTTVKKLPRVPEVTK